MVKPDRVADDLGREAVSGIGGGLGRHPASMPQPLRSGERPRSWQCPCSALIPPAEAPTLTMGKVSGAVTVYSGAVQRGSLHLQPWRPVHCRGPVPDLPG